MTATSPIVCYSGDHAHAAETMLADATDAGGRTVHSSPKHKGRTELVTVTAKRRARVNRNSVLGGRSTLETPYSISEVTAEQIKTRGAADINATFALDSSVKIANSGVASGNTFRVRGLLLDRTNGYKVDGLPFPYWFQDMPLDHFESVQLLKGVGGFLYGFATPGGILDFQSKPPFSSWRAEADVGVRSSGIASQHVDFGGPIGVVGDMRVRINIEHEEGTLYNGAYNEEHSASLAAAGSITPTVSWALNALYVRTLQTGQINSIALNATEGAVTQLPAVNGKLDLGSAGARKTNVNPIITPSVTWQISPDWSATLVYRYATLDERFPGNTATILNNAGAYANYAFNMNRYFEYNLGQGLIEGRISTGPLRHDIVAGASSTNVIFDLFNPLPPVSLGTGNIYTDARAAPIASRAAAYAYDRQDVHYTLYQKIWQNALFVSDTVALGPLSLLAGLRYNDYAETDFTPTTARQVISYNLHPITPTYALTLDVAPQTKLYVSYAEALSTGLTTPTTGVSNPNQYLPPYTSRQYEGGLKTAYGPLSATLALFRIQEPVGLYGAVQPGQTLPIYALGGLARFQGIEFNATARVTRDLNLTASAADLDAIYVRGTTVLHNQVVSAAGKTIPGTSAFQGSLLADYTIPIVAGLRVNAAVNYIGSGYGDTLDLLRFPSSTTVDIGASYRVPVRGRSVTLRGSIQNLLDHEYWAYDQAQVSAAPPRTFSLNLQVDL